jgi:hypothetical protein
MLKQLMCFSRLCELLFNSSYALADKLYSLAAAGEVAVSITTIIYCILKDERVYKKLTKTVRSDPDNDHTYV